MNLSSVTGEWKLKRIRDDVEILYGKGLPTSKRNSTGGILVYGSNGIIGKHTEFLVEEPTIVIGRKGSAGAVTLTKEKCYPIDTTYYVKIRNSSKLELEFLYYLLLNFNLSKKAQTGPVPGLHRDQIYDLEYLQPSMAMQIKIVQKLDYLFTDFEEKKRRIMELQNIKIASLISTTNSFKQRLQKSTNLEYQLRQFIISLAYSGDLTVDYRAKNLHLFSSFVTSEYTHETRDKERIDEWTISTDTTNENKEQSITGIDVQHIDLPKIPRQWLWTNIGSISNFIGSGITPLGGKSVYVDGGIPFIRSQNVYPGELRLDDVSYITPQMHSRMSRTHVMPLDVLLNITGASIGRCTSVPPAFGPANVNQHVCIIRTNNMINPEFLSWWLNSSFIQKKISNIQRGQTREGLNYSHIRSLPLPLTTVEEQNEIIAKFKEKFSLMESIKRRLNSIVNLHKKTSIYLEYVPRAILDRAFSGKLVNKIEHC